MNPVALRADRRWRIARAFVMAALVLVIVAAIVLVIAPAGHAAPVDPTPPTDPAAPADPTGGGLNVSINGPDGSPSSAIVTLIGRASCRKECRSRWSPYH